jgi:16S rRNA (adenine1518-N6/adenine1519-N6)-dimethyltransferase
MCDAGAVGASDTVFEIGPGTGVLTHELLKRDARVIALEADLRAIESLQETFATEITSGQLTIHHGDARAIDFEALQLTNTTYKCIANIPYYLSGHLFRTMLETPHHPSDLVFLVQKEVAERIARDPKESILSLSVKAFGTPKYIKTVAAGHFNPPPAVDSGIISISDISHGSFAEITIPEFFLIVKTGLAAKRKQLLGNLSVLYSRTQLTNTFSTLAIPKDIRGEDVSITKWLELVQMLTIHTLPTHAQL